MTFDQTKGLARGIARHLESKHSKLVLSEMSRALRKGKVFVDWSQNDEHKTTVNVYSLRAKELPTVSTPLTWKEVQGALNKKDPQLLAFISDQVLKRVDKFGDLFEPALTDRQDISAFLSTLKRRT